jgi:hypothetical protein
MKKYRVVIVIFASSLAVSFSAFAHGQKDSFRNDSAATEMGRNELVPLKVSDGDTKIAVITGVLTVDGKSVTVKDETLNSIKPGQNVVLVLNGGTAVLSGVVLSKTGDSDDANQSNFTGMNAADLASGGARLTLENVQITSGADGANAVFPTGKESIVTVTGLKVYTTGNSLCGLDAAYGGTFLVIVHNQMFSGDIVCDSISCMDFVLAAGTVYTGSVNRADEGSVFLTLEKTSVWNVTGDSYVASLKDTDTSLLNIKSNGHTVYYDSNNDDNSIFGGKSVTLADGGKLVPYRAVHTSELR